MDTENCTRDTIKLSAISDESNTEIQGLLSTSEQILNLSVSGALLSDESSFQLIYRHYILC